MQPAQLLSRAGFRPPKWAASLHAVPQHGRVVLGHLPTPIMPWACPALRDLGVQWWLKRDDMSGVELSGNKVRKLEFLMAEALAGDYDSVVTVGGLQSNHCRATVAAARLLGLESHLILLVADTLARSCDVGLTGNLLLDRLLGAELHLCPASEYRRMGGDLAAMDRLCEEMRDQLRARGKRPYMVPVGGTCPLSAWAYIMAVDELQSQLAEMSAASGGTAAPKFDHIVFAVGSGGTATGLALGCQLSGLSSTCQLHGVNVQHTPELFYDNIDAEAAALGLDSSLHGCARDWLRMHDGSGIAYGHATPELLTLIHTVAECSGVALDHIYTGKALHYFCKAAAAEPQAFEGKNILFWHTGGLLALASKEKQLLELPSLMGPKVRALHLASAASEEDPTGESMRSRLSASLPPKAPQLMVHAT